MRYLAAAAFAFASGMAFAGPPVYRCETGSKVAYSDAPCIGAKVVDATPTQGADKWTGKSRKSVELQHAELNNAIADALRPFTGKSRDEMGVARRRVYLTAENQGMCARLDARMPTLEEAAARTAQASLKSQAEFDLYSARKKFFELKC